MPATRSTKRSLNKDILTKEGRKTIMKKVIAENPIPVAMLQFEETAKEIRRLELMLKAQKILQAKIFKQMKTFGLDAYLDQEIEEEEVQDDLTDYRTPTPAPVTIPILSPVPSARRSRSSSWDPNVLPRRSQRLRTPTPHPDRRPGQPQPSPTPYTPDYLALYDLHENGQDDQVTRPTCSACGQQGHLYFQCRVAYGN